jgi:PAS domain-containing protein
MSGNPPLLPASAPLLALDASPDACYVLSEQLVISYCNAAWNRFAREQGGNAAVLAENIVGRNLLEFIPADLRDFYQKLFAQARALSKAVGHDYECSSASVFRLYRLEAYPLRAGAGFVVENSLRIERPHDRTPLQPENGIYTDSNGIITCCANCRRTRRAANHENWDWVPAYVESKQLNVSHGICPMCFEFYYRPVIESWAA